MEDSLKICDTRKDRGNKADSANARIIDLLPIMGEAQMVQEFPPAFYRVLEEQKTWQK